MENLLDSSILFGSQLNLFTILYTAFSLLSVDNNFVIPNRLVVLFPFSADRCSSAVAVIKHMSM